MQFRATYMPVGIRVSKTKLEMERLIPRRSDGGQDRGLRFPGSARHEDGLHCVAAELIHFGRSRVFYPGVADDNRIGIAYMKYD
jgi:hypothetical protein